MRKFLKIKGGLKCFLAVSLCMSALIIFSDKAQADKFYIHKDISKIAGELERCLREGEKRCVRKSHSSIKALKHYKQLDDADTKFLENYLTYISRWVNYEEKQEEEAKEKTRQEELEIGKYRYPCIEVPSCYSDRDRKRDEMAEKERKIRANRSEAKRRKYEKYKKENRQ